MILNPLTQILGRTERIIRNRWFEMNRPQMVSAQTFSDKTFLTKFNLPEVAGHLKEGHVTAAKKALLAHYGTRARPVWPVFPGQITDLEVVKVETNLAELNREELIDRANFFLNQGRINWRDNPNQDQERLWWLNRQSWWPLLALAYSQTGDERYVSQFVEQMLDWVNVNPPPAQKDEASPAWRLMEVGLRLRISWIPCFALFYHSPAFTDDAKLTMLRSIYDHARFLSLFTSTRNHLLRESNGLAYVSTYFPEFKEASTWQQAALTRLDAELTAQINQDGSQIEVSTGYQWLVVDEYQLTCDLLRTHNLALPKENLAVWLEKMYQVLAYLIRPDGIFPQINDGYVFQKRDRLAEAGVTFKRDDLVYIGTDGSRGVSPTITSVGFNDAGLYVMRSDWTKDARYLLFDAGPYGGPHGHEDKLSFELYAFGQSFVVDPGSYTYHKLDPFRTYFVGSQGHNTVLVDGQSQIRGWRKGNLHPKPALGNYATWLSQPDFDYVVGTYSDGYSHFSLKKPKDAAIIEDVIHTRRILFVKPDYWLLVDELRANQPHHYQVLFHTPPEIKASLGLDKRVVLTKQPDAAALCLIPTEPENLKVSYLAGGENPIQGWYSAGSRHKAPATVIIYERENSLSTVMTTLLYLCPPGQTGEGVSIKSLSVSGGAGFAFVVVTPGGYDYFMISPDNSLKQFGPFQSSGRVAGVRTDQQNKILSRFEGR